MAVSAPNFYFRIQRLVAHRDIVRSDNHHDWLPPRQFGGNTVHRLLDENEVFHFIHRRPQDAGDDFQPYVGANPVPLPDHIAEEDLYQCYSLYVGEHDDIWTVDYNASEHQVWDGNDTGADIELDDEDELQPDWKELSFRRAESSNTLSYAAYNQGRRHLVARHGDQQWPRQLLPRQYQGERTRHRGGLVGDTPLLLGLLALSVPEHMIVTALPRLLGAHWRCSSRYGDETRRAHRGVFVTVWLDLPIGTDDDHYDQLYDAFQRRMQEYEEGYLGAHFQ